MRTGRRTSWSEGRYPAPYSISWNTHSVADGAHALSVIVTDLANNVSTINLGNKVVDNTAPTAAVGAPTPGALLTGTVSFSSTASDANLASVEYYVNGAQIGSGKVGEGVEETAKGIGKTVEEGAKYTGEKLKEAGKSAEPEAKSTGRSLRDGAVSFGHSVKNFFTRLFQ